MVRNTTNYALSKLNACLRKLININNKWSYFDIVSELTEKEERFIEAYFNLLSEDFTSNTRRITEAAKQTGYSTGYALQLAKKLHQEISSITQYWLALHLPDVAADLVDIVKNPSQLGAKTKLQAITVLMDRGGLPKVERLETKTELPNALLILPPKDPI